MPRVLVTGSSGLIGQELFKWGLGSRFSLVSFDIRDSLKDNILNFQKLKRAMEGCVGVVHLAGTSRVIHGEFNPGLCLTQNVEGAKNVIEAALQTHPNPWIIYASSREVYGQQKILPVEEDACLNPINVYGISKMKAEHLILEARVRGLNTNILRFSNVFGGVNDYVDRVIPAFCHRSLKDLPLKVEGVGNVFDFTFVDNVACGILKLVNLLTENPKKHFPTIHLTTGRGVSLLEAAKIIIKRSNSRSNIVESNPRQYDVTSFYGSVDRAKELLGWSHDLDFEEAIDKFLLRLKEYSAPSPSRVFGVET